MWIWLAVAILAEVTGTVALRYSEGFTRLLPSSVVVLGYGVAFVALARSLVRGMPLGLGYAVWAGTGVALVAVLGAVLFSERLSPLQIGGLVLVVAGVVALEAGQPDTA